MGIGCGVVVGAVNGGVIGEYGVLVYVDDVVGVAVYVVGCGVCDIGVGVVTVDMLVLAFVVLLLLLLLVAGVLSV